MTTVIAVLIAVVATLIIAIPVSSKVAVSRKVREDQAKIGSAEEKARQIIDDALKGAETKKREALLEAKEESLKIKNESEGAIVPFHRFYDALENFLDHSHRGVIIRAYDNTKINPEKKTADVFAINVLKTLFMIKYILEIEANVDNITSLMISSIDDDRIVLRDQVEEALKTLQKQMLVQKNGSIFVFLTDEEQAADTRRKVNGSKSTISALHTGILVEMPDQHDRTSGTMRHITKLPKDRPDFICPVHIDIRSEKCLDRIDNNELHAVLSDSSLNSAVRKSKLLTFTVINDQYPVQISSGFNEPRLYRVAQPILCGLVDNIKRFLNFHSR